MAVQVFGTSHGVLAIASQFDWVVDFLRNERRASGYYILLATWKTFLTVKLRQLWRVDQSDQKIPHSFTADFAAPKIS